VNAERFEIVLTDRGVGDLTVGHDGHFGAVGRVDGEGGLALDHNRLDIGHLLQAQALEVPGRQLDQSFGRGHLGGASGHLTRRIEQGDVQAVYVAENNGFRLPRDSGAPVIMVGAGTGIAPFRGMIAELLLGPQKTASQIHLLMGAPYTTDLLYDDLFSQLSTKHENFHYHTAISREPRANGAAGPYVHHLLDQQMDSFRPLLENPKTLVYICGLAGMQCGVFQTLARHGLGDAYFTAKKELACQDPNDWDLNGMRRSVKCSKRCMVEVY